MDDLIQWIREREDALLDFWDFLDRLSRRLPPSKNENKFLYGKQSEYRFRDLCKEVGSSIEILGDDSYFDDFVYGEKKTRFSYKTTKINGSIRVVNFYKKKIVLNETFLDGKNLCIANIKKRQLYLFPLDLLPLDLYRERIDGIELSSRYIKYIEKHHPQQVISMGSKEREEEKDKREEKKEEELCVNEMVYQILCKEDQKSKKSKKRKREKEAKDYVLNASSRRIKPRLSELPSALGDVPASPRSQSLEQEQKPFFEVQVPGPGKVLPCEGQGQGQGQGQGPPSHV